MKVQLANTYNPDKNYRVKNWFATPKFDGVRAVFIPHEGLFTRNNKLIHGLENMQNALESVCAEKGLSFVDGELILSGATFQASQSVILSAEHKDKANVEFHVFAVGGDFDNTLDMLDTLPHQPEANIFRVDSVIILNDFQSVENACRKFTQQGYEGVVLRNPSISYFNGRSDYLLKYKFFKEADLRITGVQMGTGKLEGMLGSLNVEGMIDGVNVRSCVGTGLTDDDRKILIQDKNLVGKVLTVKYQALTERADKNGYYSLRFPVVIGLKEDRDFSKCSVAERPLKKSISDKPADVAYHRNGIVEADFQIQFVNKPARKFSFMPDKKTMFTWKEKLGQCKSVQEGIKLIADLKLTVIKLRAFAKYLGVKMTGCKYLKAEIIRWVVSASLGAWLRAEALMKFVKGGEYSLMSEIEQRLTEAREHLRKRQHEVFHGLRAYRHYRGKVDRIREEWPGLCETRKKCKHIHRDHLIGLLLLEERMRDKYRDVRLHSPRLRAEYRELFFEALSARWRVCRLKRRLRKFKEVELCAEM